LAWLQMLHVCGDFENLAGDFRAWRERQRRLYLVLAGDHQDIREVHATGMHSKPHMPGL